MIMMIYNQMSLLQNLKNMETLRQELVLKLRAETGNESKRRKNLFETNEFCSLITIFQG